MFYRFYVISLSAAFLSVNFKFNNYIRYGVETQLRRHNEQNCAFEGWWICVNTRTKRRANIAVKNDYRTVDTTIILSLLTAKSRLRDKTSGRTEAPNFTVDRRDDKEGAQRFGRPKSET